MDLVRTSVRLIKDNPWLGVGPKNVDREAVRYRGRNEFADWLYQHMHNDFLQIAAERGIPGLLLWLWFMIRLGWDALKVHRSAHKGISGKADPDAHAPLMVATSALGGWVAFLVAGMFEYNFGDSEVLTLFLFIMASPYVSLRLRTAVAKD
jgi:O-antigen ligase